MSHLFAIKQLNGRKTIFLRFAGPDHFLIEVNGAERIVTREFWEGLPLLSPTDLSNPDKLG